MGRQESIDANEHKFDGVIGTHQVQYEVPDAVADALAEMYTQFTRKLHEIDIRYKKEQYERDHPYSPPFSNN